MTGPGPKSKLSEPESFQISLPRETYDYLVRLGRLGKLGNKVHTIVEHIVIREVDAMRQSGYHKQTIDD